MECTQCTLLVVTLELANCQCHLLWLMLVLQYMYGIAFNLAGNLHTPAPVLYLQNLPVQRARWTIVGITANL